MDIHVLFAVATFFLSQFRPFNLPPEKVIERSMPYYEAKTDYRVDEVGFNWANFRLGGFTKISWGTGSCSQAINVSYMAKEDILMRDWIINHEMFHVYQGPDCKFWNFNLEDGKLNISMNENRRYRIENTATLGALEIQAEMCQDGLLGACADFWWQVHYLTGRMIQKENGKALPYQADRAYISGPWEILMESEGGEMPGAVIGKPLLLDDTWELLTNIPEHAMDFNQLNEKPVAK